MDNNLLKKNKGFSLIEIMVSLAVFSIVVLVAAGALLSIIDGARKTQALKSVINNLNFAMEDMSRNLRVGTSYYCGEGANGAQGQSCAPGATSNAVTFKSNKFSSIGNTPIYMGYKFDNVKGQLLFKDDLNGTGDYVPITAPEVTISKATFTVLGASAGSTGDQEQPRILITIQGSAGLNLRSQSNFNIQTSITQRVLDY